MYMASTNDITYMIMYNIQETKGRKWDKVLYTNWQWEYMQVWEWQEKRQCSDIRDRSMSIERKLLVLFDDFVRYELSHQPHVMKRLPILHICYNNTHHKELWP